MIKQLAVSRDEAAENPIPGHVLNQQNTRNRSRDHLSTNEPSSITKGQKKVKNRSRYADIEYGIWVFGESHGVSGHAIGTPWESQFTLSQHTIKRGRERCTEKEKPQSKLTLCIT